MNQTIIDSLRLDVFDAQGGTKLEDYTAVEGVQWVERLNEAGEWSLSLPSELFDPAVLKTGRFVKLYDTSANASTTADADMLFAGPVDVVDTSWGAQSPTPSVKISGADALGLLVDDEQDGLIANRAWETPDYVALINLKYSLEQAVPEFTDDNDATWANIDLDFKDDEGVDGNGYTHVSRILVAHETPYNKIRLYVRGLNEGGTWPYFPQPQTPRGLRVELIDGDAWAEYETVDTTQSLAYQPFSKAGFGEISWTPLSLPAQSVDEASGAKGYIVRIRSINPNNDELEEPEGGTGRFGANRMQVYIAVPNTTDLETAIDDYCPGFSLAAGSPSGSTDGTLWQFYAETGLGILQELSRRTGFNFVRYGADKIKWFEGYPTSTVLTVSEHTDPSTVPANYFFVDRAQRVSGRRPFFTRITPFGAGSDDGAKVDLSKFNPADVTLPAGYAVVNGQVINQTAETNYGKSRHRVIDFPSIGGVDGGTGTTRQLSAELVKAAVAWLQMNYADSEHWRLSGYNLKAGTFPGEKITVANLSVVDTAGSTVEAVNKQMIITGITHTIDDDGVRYYSLDVSNTGAFPPNDWRLLTEQARIERQRVRYPQPASQNKLVNSLNTNAGSAAVGETGESADQVQDNLDAHIAETVDAHGIPAQIDAKITTHAALANAHHNRSHDLDSGSDHTGTLSWAKVNKTGSDLDDLETKSLTVLTDRNLTNLTTRNHSDLQNISANDHHNAATSGAGVAVSGSQQVSLSPGTLSSASTNSAPTGGTHTHAITASAAPSTSELLKADGAGGLELQALTVSGVTDVYDVFKQAVDGTTYFRHGGVATYRSASTGLGPYVVIETTIGDTPASAEQFMLALRVAVLQFGTNKPPAYVDIHFYNYQTNNKIWMSYESTSRSITGVQVARNVATGKTAVLIQMSATIDYPLVVVDAVNQFRAASSYFDGWSVAMKANTTDYSNLQTVPDLTGLKPAQLLTGTAGAAITWSATQTFNGLIDANANLDVQGETYLRDDLHLMGTANVEAEGDLDITADGDITIDAGSGDILTPSQVSADNWVSGVTAWGITPAGAADFRVISADELRVKVFISELQRALAGEQIVGKSIAILAEDFTPATAVDGTATLTVYDLPNAANAQVFEPGDYVGIKYVDTTGGGLNVGEAIGVVSAYTDLADGLQSWTFTTKVLLPVAVTIPLESVAIDYGVSGDGLWRVSAIDPAGAPHASVETWTTLPTNRTVQTRLGNLDGIAGQSGFGLFAGNPAGEFIRINESGLVVAGDGSGLTDIQGGQVVVTGGGDLNAALGDLADEDSALSQSLNALASKGEQLVTNGDGSLGDNTNFSTFTFEGADVPPGLLGAFRETTFSIARFNDEFIAVNPNLTYRLEFMIKAAVSAGQKHYLGLVCYDVDNLKIDPWHWLVKPGTETTLAQPYTPGDSVIYLTDATGWDVSWTGMRWMRFGNYKNSFGRDYGDYGYSRHTLRPTTYNATTWTVSGNDLTIGTTLLTDPANPDDPSGTWPIGTPVAMTKSDGAYLYTVSLNETTPADWELKHGLISGFAATSAYTSTEFWPGTAKVKLVMLLNYTTAGGATLISGVRMSVDIETAREAVLNWAQNGDITLINGGTIATNTILADSIAANTITADEIAANTITAAEIAAGTITADEIAANAITAAKVAAGAITAEKLTVGLLSQNLILNPTFDADATLWSLSSGAARDATQAHIGAASMRLPLYGRGVSFKARVSPGEPHLLAFYTYGTGGATLLVKANYQSSVTSDDYITSGVADSTATLWDNSVNEGAWTRRQAVFTPPAGHEWVSLDIYNDSLASVFVYVDAIELKPMVTGTYIEDGSIVTDNLAATAIDGMTITGSTVQTDSTSDRLQLTNAGMEIPTGDDTTSIGSQLPGQIVAEPISTPAAIIKWMTRLAWDQTSQSRAGVPKLFANRVVDDAGINGYLLDDVLNLVVDNSGEPLMPVGGAYTGNSMKTARVQLRAKAHSGREAKFTVAARRVTDFSSIAESLPSAETSSMAELDSNGVRIRLRDGGLSFADDTTAPSTDTMTDVEEEAFVYYNSGELLVKFQNGATAVLATDYAGEQTPTLVNSWANYGSGWKVAHYWREGDTVHLGGFVTNATSVANDEVMFTLPAGYRPTGGDVMYAQMASTGTVRIDVEADGEVRWGGGSVGSVGYLSLSGISFRV